MADENAYPIEMMRSVAVTENDGSTAHRVTHDQVAGLLHGASTQALCGLVFVPAAMSTPDGKPCRLCAEIAVCAETTARQVRRSNRGAGPARRRLSAFPHSGSRRPR